MTTRESSSCSSSSSSSSSSSVGADAFQALRDQIKRIQMGAWPNAVYLFGLVDNLERQVHEGITHLQKQANANATAAVIRDEELAAALKALQEWRGWAQFVYLGGGSVTLDDKALQSAVCAKHDEETLAARRDTQAGLGGRSAAEQQRGNITDDERTARHGRSNCVVWAACVCGVRRDDREGCARKRRRRI